MNKSIDDIFVRALSGKDREAYEAFGIELRKWVMENVGSTGEDFVSVVDAAALVFASVVSSYVCSGVSKASDIPLARRCTCDIVNKRLLWCFDQASTLEENSRVH